jgi:hypothetical protein
MSLGTCFRKDLESRVWEDDVEKSWAHFYGLRTSTSVSTFLLKHSKSHISLRKTAYNNGLTHIHDKPSSLRNWHILCRLRLRRLGWLWRLNHHLAICLHSNGFWRTSARTSIGIFSWGWFAGGFQLVSIGIVLFYLIAGFFCAIPGSSYLLDSLW